MPYHLELGSEGHSFHGKAIVVNSQTGEHKTKHPLPIDLAKAQMKALEHREAPPAPKAKKELHEDYKGPRNKDGTPKKSTKAWGMYVRDRDRPKPEMMKMKHEAQKEDIPEREGEGVKQVKAKEVKKEEPKKTTFPLVTREEYKLHLKLLHSAFIGKKALVKDRPLQAELADTFFNTGGFGGMRIYAQAFTNALTSIYNDTIKRKERFRNPPTELEWLDWFNASKTGQTDGIDWTKSDNYRYGGLEKYFNIYPDANGKAREFHNKEYGYFYGFAGASGGGDGSK